MQSLANISDRQKIVFGNTENGYFWHYQNTDNQYSYNYKTTPNSTGKELDAETGYSYFGARYLDHALTTAWLSVDPMADKYPSISPYAYCAWNSLKLVDPEGREIVIKDGTNEYYYRNGHVYLSNNHGSLPMDEKLGKDARKIKMNLDKISENKAGAKVVNRLVNNKRQTYTISADATSGEGNYTASTNKVSLNRKYNNLMTLSHELFHAYQDDNGRTPHTIYNEVEAYVFCGVISGRSLGMTSESNMEYRKKGSEFVKGLMKGGPFNCDTFQYLLDNFKCSSANWKGTYNNYASGKYKACDSLLINIFK